MKLTIGKKLFVAFVGILLLSVFVSVVSFSILSKSRKNSIDLINESNLITEKTERLKYDLLEMNDSLRGLLTHLTQGLFNSNPYRLYVRA